MAEYEPTSRRPIADTLRRSAWWAVRLCVRWGIHPDAISYSSLAASAAGAICFWQAGHAAWLLIPAVLCCFLRLWCNMLDGMVALESGKASLRGEVLNEMPDRLSDVIIFVGVAHSGLCHPLGGYWVAIFALLVAYVGVLAQALGVGRDFSGLMSKPWRMVTLAVGAWITLGLLWSGDGSIRFAGLTVLDWTHTVIVVGCMQTLFVRLARTLRALQEQAQSDHPTQSPEGKG